ncbi:MAG: hypothetical protein IJQ84_09470 [Paludibacteraceae bacterium]|nr:hypothetical protein [Paludibacteraceae bacterium]
MKKLFLFLFASLLSVSMFAVEKTGKNKAEAIPYNWGTGIFVESTAGEGKWYVVNLLNTMAPEGPFDKTTGKTSDGKTNINVMVVNPLDESATIDVVAYMGDNETSRHFTLAKGGSKSMTFGAGMLVKMGIDRVYLYLVMDVDITKEEAAQMEAVHVNVTPVENENSVVFTPINFNWTNWPSKTEATVIPANQETWIKVKLDQENQLSEGKTYKFYAENAGGATTTIYAGLSYDCPATSIQQETKELAAGSAKAIQKVLDADKLSMIPDSVYVRIKADQEIRLYAERVALPEPDPEAPVILNKNEATNIELGTVYDLNAHQVYKVGYNTLKAQEFYYKQIEVTNNGSEAITIIGKATKTFDASGNAYSATSKSVTIPAGQTYTKVIDKTMLSAVGSQTEDSIWAIGPNANVTFKLAEYCTETDPCVPAEAIAMAIPLAGTYVEKNQAANSTKWYAVDITNAKNAQADIELTMTASNAETVEVTVDVAADCALGEPTQSYTGSSKSTKKTLSYSLIKDAGNVVYVRVKTNKEITVKAQIIDQVIYTSTGWNQNPSADKAARIEADLTITATDKLEVLGITLADDKKITIENGGKLFVGKEGFKGSNTSDQIVINDGGVLMIDPACTSNNHPFITSRKGLWLGVQQAAGAQLPELHEFIALPISNREAGVGKFLRYSNWVYTAGWRSSDNFRNAFVGYNVFNKSGDADFFGDHPDTLVVSYKGQLADNHNQTLVMPGEGWHAFGNSWFEAVNVEDIFSQLGGSAEEEVAVHKYIATPQDVNGVPYLDNQYALVTAENIGYLTDEFKTVASMEGFFLYTAAAKSITLNYNKVWNDRNAVAPAPARRAANENINNVAVVVRGGYRSDHVFMVETTGSNVHKMMGNGLALYAEDGLGQVASDNLIGTILTLQTNDATEYTLSFAWLKGETLFLQDMENGKVIAMTADNTYTFNAEPNTVSERFQVVGRSNAPTAIENSEVVEGANKFIENGRVVIIKNGVKYDVLGTQIK